MFTAHNQAFNAPSRDGAIRPIFFDRHLVMNFLVAVYSDVLEEPLPDKLERLVRRLEAREAAVRGR
jgi:hypothetical protein